jgi:hypothetical protein
VVSTKHPEDGEIAQPHRLWVRDGRLSKKYTKAVKLRGDLKVKYIL